MPFPFSVSHRSAQFVTEHEAWYRVCSLARACVHLLQVKSCAEEYGLVIHCQQLCSCVVLQLEYMEKVQNCQDPEFCNKLVVGYYFDKVQKLKFSVYDIDNKSFDLNDDDYLGEIECAGSGTCRCVK